MQAASLADWVSQVIEVHGTRAAREAARQAHLCDRFGKPDLADVWRLVADEIERQPRLKLH